MNKTFLLACVASAVVVGGRVLVACGESGTSGSQFVPGPVDAGAVDPQDGGVTFADGGGGVSPDSPEYACFMDTTTVAACRTCCERLRPAERRVFVNAANECLCQPSKCGSVCADTLCAGKDSGLDCTRCSNATLRDAGADGRVNPPVDSGADRGEIYDCGRWASAVCQADEGCREAEECKFRARCASKQP